MIIRTIFFLCENVDERGKWNRCMENQGGVCLDRKKNKKPHWYCSFLVTFWRNQECGNGEELKQFTVLSLQ